MKPQPSSSDGQASPDFADIVSDARERSAIRLEQLRRRAEAIAQEQQTRWDNGIALLNERVRPLLERALQACAEEGIPAILQDNFLEQAATPRLMFHCEAASRGQILGPVSIRMIVESDGTSVRAGTAKSFSTYPDGMQVCENVEESLSGIFSAVLESYFQSCEQAQARECGA